MPNYIATTTAQTTHPGGGDLWGLKLWHHFFTKQFSCGRARITFLQGEPNLKLRHCDCKCFWPWHWH